MTQLCAEAIGWKHLGAIGVKLAEDERRGSVADAKYPGKLWCLSGANDWWENPEGNSVCGPCQGIPDPLHDDAQAMALVKKLGLTVDPQEDKPPFTWRVVVADDGDWDKQIFSQGSDLNRAIVECAAKMFSSSQRGKR